MNKLQKKAQKSKLNLEKEKGGKVISLSRQAYSRVHSFRLDDASWNHLTDLLEKINSFSARKISASRLIKALIYLGCQCSEENLIQALKEVAI